MNKPKFTQGNWAVSGAKHIYASGVEGGNIATVSSPRKSTFVGYHELKLDDADFSEACENARLIAAAPDLAEALNELYKWANKEGYIGGFINKAKQALLKAGYTD